MGQSRTGIKGKVAIVTASAGAGIGQGVARALANHGANVVICDIHSERTPKVAIDIKNNSGVDTLPVLCDITKADDVRNMVEKTLSTFGRIDILINNAGVDRNEPVVAMSDKTWDFVISVNLKGTFHCCRAVLPTMLNQKSGRIVNMASVSAWVDIDNGAAYSASKAGIIGFTRALATEVATQGITVNAIAPGFILNDYISRVPEAMQLFEKYKDRILLGRYGTPADIANMALFLVSDEASFITGETMCVSGGFYMH